ncbi:MAG TPA: pentapeptide repeat-containing protein, partial [Flavobacteriaceae bacterium]|nr:pentapeptide repeat-containing protein [Flavobacteriaceae bacterium]
FSKANFDNCDLKNAVFEQTNLEQANFFTAINYSINPERNKIKGAKFSKDQISGLLDTYKIIIS